MTNERLGQSVWLAVVGVFVFTLALFLSLYFRSSGLPLQDDAYYHIRHALSYCTDASQVKMPVYSTMTTHRTDLYVGYHALMCPFVGLFSHGNYEAMYAGAKVFNSLLNTLFMAFFFAIVWKLLRRRDVSPDRALIISLLSCLYLFTAVYYFFDRLYFIRPEIFGITAVVGSYYAIEAKKWCLLGLLAFLLPFFYSVSFFVLFPAIAFVLASLLYDYRILFKKETWLPLGISGGALILGILCHPDVFNYVYNAYFIHILTIYNRFANPTVGEGSELYSPSRSFALNFMWLIPLLIFLCIYIYKIVRKHSLRHSIEFRTFYLLLEVLLLLPAFLMVERAAEYFAPFMAFLFAIMLAAFYEKIKIWGLESIRTTGNAFRDLRISLRQGLSSQPKALAWFFSLWLLAMFSHTYYDLANLIKRTPSNRFEAAGKFLSEHSNENDIVFNFGIEQYAYLVFFDNTNRYIMGMGSTFTHVYEEGVYLEYAHAVSGTPICETLLCDNNAKDLYTALKNDFQARFVIVDEQEKDRFAKAYGVIENDKRFELVWNDTPGIRIYRLQ